MCRIFTRSTDIFSARAGKSRSCASASIPRPPSRIGSTRDNTLKSVERIALGNGYDSFLMFNVYAQRATRPNDMERVCNEALHRANMEAFDYILSLSEQPAVWAAWGNIIEQRAYLKDCLADMIAIGERHGAQWYTAGRRSVKGHPHHPLYLKATSPLDAFDIRAYCAECL